MGGAQHVRIDMDEVRALQTDPARLMYQRLCGWIDPGKSGRVELDTLCGYVWPGQATNPVRSRRDAKRLAGRFLSLPHWAGQSANTQKTSLKSAGRKQRICSAQHPKHRKLAMRNDWETPTVEELIVRAWIGEDGQPDVLHVQGVDVADDIGNLDRVIGDPDNLRPRQAVRTGRQSRNDLPFSSETVSASIEVRPVYTKIRTRPV
jgi:hypothetical protein